MLCGLVKRNVLKGLRRVIKWTISSFAGLLEPKIGARPTSGLLVLVMEIWTSKPLIMNKRVTSWHGVVHVACYTIAVLPDC